MKTKDKKITHPYTILITGILLFGCNQQKSDNIAIIKNLDELTYRQESAKLNTCFMLSIALQEKMNRVDHDENFAMAAEFLSEKIALDSARMCENISPAFLKCKTVASVKSGGKYPSEQEPYFQSESKKCADRFSIDIENTKGAYKTCSTTMTSYNEKYIAPLSTENFIRWTEANAEPGGDGLNERTYRFLIASNCTSTFAKYLQ